MMPAPAAAARPLVALAMALVIATATAQEPKLLPPEQAFRFSARALDEGTLEARFNVADGYYMYRDKFRFDVDPAAVGPVVAQLPPGKVKDDEFFGKVEVYRDLVVVKLPIPKAAAGRTVVLKVESQGCADVGVCYPPQLQQIRMEMPAPGTGPTPAIEANAGKLPWQK
jgi:thiol:disulfide interchange protein DsbD